MRDKLSPSTAGFTIHAMQNEKNAPSTLFLVHFFLGPAIVMRYDHYKRHLNVT